MVTWETTILFSSSSCSGSFDLVILCEESCCILILCLQRCRHNLFICFSHTHRQKDLKMLKSLSSPLLCSRKDSGTMSSYLGIKLCGSSLPVLRQKPWWICNSTASAATLLPLPGAGTANIAFSLPGAACSSHSSTQSSRARHWPWDGAGDGHSANSPCDLYYKPQAEKRAQMLCVSLFNVHVNHQLFPDPLEGTGIVLVCSRAQGEASLTGSLSLLTLSPDSFLGAAH